jgi:hypothetical protein
MKETFKQYLESSCDGKEVKQLLEGYSRLESYIEGTLDEAVASEDRVQKLRKEIYMDVGLSPLDKRVFPEVLKSYYTFVYQKDLSTPQRLTKGQSNGQQ